MVRVAGLFSPFVRLVRKLYFRFLKDKVSRVLEFIDRIQTKYLKKGQLKNYVLVRYIVKELLLYFVVAFLFFFMIFFCNQILLLAEQILKKRVPFADVCRLIAFRNCAVCAVCNSRRVFDVSWAAYERQRNSDYPRFRAELCCCNDSGSDFGTCNFNFFFFRE